jgi:hypothetical protein
MSSGVGGPFFCQNELHSVAFVERSRKNISRVSRGQGCSDSVERAHFTIGIAELSISMSSFQHGGVDSETRIRILKLPPCSSERPFFEGSSPNGSQWGVTRHRSGRPLDRLYVQRRHAAVAMACSRTGRDGGEKKGGFWWWVGGRRKTAVYENCSPKRMAAPKEVI